MGAITGPGDDTEQRMAINLTVGKGSTMRIETGAAEQVLFLEITGRTLADVTETERRSYVISIDQAAWLAAELGRAVLGAG